MLVTITILYIYSSQLEHGCWPGKAESLTSQNQKLCINFNKMLIKRGFLGAPNSRAVVAQWLGCFPRIWAVLVGAFGWPNPDQDFNLVIVQTTKLSTALEGFFSKLHCLDFPL